MCFYDTLVLKLDLLCILGYLIFIYLFLQESKFRETGVITPEEVCSVVAFVSVCLSVCCVNMFVFI